MSLTVFTPCFPRFNGDYHGVFVKELCDNLHMDVGLSVLAPRSKTLGVLNTDYTVQRFPYLPSTSLETLPEETMKGAPASRLTQLPFYMWGANQALRKIKPIIIHTHLAIPLGVLSSIHNSPSVITCHGSDLTLPLQNQIYQPFTKFALRKADKVITVSRYLQRIAEKICQNKVETIYLGVDPVKFKPAMEPKTLTIGTLGRLVEQKNIIDLLEATKNLQKQYDFTLKIGGDGPARMKLQYMANELDVKFDFNGVISNPVAFLQSLDIFVLCSTAEGLSISLQEAMSCKVTPVAADNCGCNELIVHKENGYLYEPRNIKDLEEKLEQAIHVRLGVKARKTILEHFNSTVNAKQYLEVYKELGHRF